MEKKLLTESVSKEPIKAKVNGDVKLEYLRIGRHQKSMEFGLNKLVTQKVKINEEELIDSQINEAEVTQQWLNESIRDTFDNKKYDELSLS